LKHFRLFSTRKKDFLEERRKKKKQKIELITRYNNNNNIKRCILRKREREMKIVVKYGKKALLKGVCCG
jgi:hypothetical protein